MYAKNQNGFPSYMRSFIFGVEDSLVSTIGLLSGITATGTPRNVILFTGIIYIFVEAFSMAVGSVLSEHSAEEYAVRNSRVGWRRSEVSGLIMFISFVVSGFIPLTPYLLLSNIQTGFIFSILLSLATLLLLGIASAKLNQRNIYQKGLEMLIMGGAAIGVGLIIGRMLHVN